MVVQIGSEPVLELSVLQVQQRAARDDHSLSE